jgi:methylenetetrahydrofolate reductase (NADPH)
MQPHADAPVLDLSRIRWEIIPLKGIEDRLPHLPEGAAVTVTSSPAKGTDATLALAETLAQSRPDVTVVPHIAARLVRDRAHITELVGRLSDLGVQDIFVVAGDAPEPAGDYEGAAAFLKDLADVGHPFERIGITGYPESHAFISDEETIRAMGEKVPYAHYICSQICYDAPTIARWVDAVRERGVTLPIYIGIPGVVDRTRLLRISMKVGLGDSVRYLRKQHGALSKFVSGYTPEDLVSGLQSAVTDPEKNVVGWHVFTFNEIDKTEAWRRDVAAQM